MDLESGSAGKRPPKKIYSRFLPATEIRSDANGVPGRGRLGDEFIIWGRGRWIWRVGPQENGHPKKSIRDFCPRQRSDLMRTACLEEAAWGMNSLFGGEVDGFGEWVRRKTATQKNLFEISARDRDLRALECLRAPKCLSIKV